MQKFSYENEFDLHENEHAGKRHFHKNGFARRLVLTLRQTITRKWSIAGLALPKIFRVDYVYNNVRYSTL